MKTGLIGSGRMAQAFGRYLKEQGCTVEGIWARNSQKGAVASTFIQCKTFETIEGLVESSDNILVVVSDDSIAEVSESIKKSISEKHFIGHMSGSLSKDILKVLQEKNAKTYSLHPLQTIANPRQGLTALKYAHLMLEAENDDVAVLLKWIEPLGNPVGLIKPGQKVLYHLGASIASNYVMVLMHWAQELMQEAGIEGKIAREALKPLIEATVSNFVEMGAVEGITGPAARGDVNTLKKHAHALKYRGDGDQVAIINALALEAVRVSIKNPNADHEKLAMALKQLKGEND